MTVSNAAADDSTVPAGLLTPMGDDPADHYAREDEQADSNGEAEPEGQAGKSGHGRLNIIPAHEDLFRSGIEKHRRRRPQHGRENNAHRRPALRGWRHHAARPDRGRHLSHRLRHRRDRTEDLDHPCLRSWDPPGHANQLSGRPGYGIFAPEARAAVLAADSVLLVCDAV